MEFKNLDNLYKYIEDDVDMSLFDSKRCRAIDILHLRDQIKDEETKKKCSYELFFYDFTIKEDMLVPHHQIGDNCYPTLQLFDDNFEYLKIRSSSVQNPKYKSKYNHLLWLSPAKHINFARQAVESYFSILESSQFSDSDNLLNKSFIRYFQNAFLLSKSVNYKNDMIITFFVELLSTKKINDYSKCILMKFIVENIKKSDKVLYQKFFDYSNSKINVIESKAVEGYLEVLIILSRKLGLDSSEFHELYGDYHLRQIKDHNKEGLGAHFFYLKALNEYRKASNKKKVEDTTVLFEQSKKELDLKKINVQLQDKDAVDMLGKIWENINTNINNLIEQGESQDIYKYLMFQDLLPNAEDLNDDVKSPFLDLVSTITYDINKNINTKRSIGINSYLIHMRTLSIPQIILIFTKGIMHGKITFESFINFLKNHTWYKEDFTYIDLNGERQGFDWIELISPSLQHFFLQIEVDLKIGKDSHQGYILPIDSLVIKFEGLLREFSRLVGAQTIEVKDEETEARISFDKLLENEKVKNLIPPNDLAFFKYLFTSIGLNLRNNVAHCFFKTENYAPSTMLLLLVALLRLGNFKFIPKEDIE